MQCITVQVIRPEQNNACMQPHIQSAIAAHPMPQIRPLADLVHSKY